MALDSIRIRQELQKDIKIRNKARTYSALTLTCLLLALLAPFCSEVKKKDNNFEKAILVQFEPEDFKEMASAAKSSSRAAANAPAAAKEEKPSEETTATTPTPVPVETPPEEPKPEKVKPTKVDLIPIRPSAQKPILTSPEPAEINIEEMLQDLPEEAQVEEVSEEVTEVTEEVSADFMAELAAFFKTSDSKPSTPSSSNSSGSGSSTGGSGTANTDKPSNGTSSTPGEGTSGKSETGDSKTDGVGNSGNSGDDFQGDGLLTRKVIKRENLKKIIKRNGKIVINLCIDQSGSVIFKKADKKKSSIKDPLLLKKAERAAGRYKYEKDYTAAKRQCGALTIIISGIE
ncbi:MAG: outer membrane biosynthesis protein TonB [Polaribacter sp.]|jgi:outer membrane biosynthesis protein TonB